MDVRLILCVMNLKKKTEIAIIDFPYALALMFFIFWNMITAGVIERLFPLEF